MGQPGRCLWTLRSRPWMATEGQTAPPWGQQSELPGWVWGCMKLTRHSQGPSRPPQQGPGAGVSPTHPLIPPHTDILIPSHTIHPFIVELLHTQFS